MVFKATLHLVTASRISALAEKLKLDIDGIAGKAIFICGIRRSGKTTLGVRIAEELGKFSIPMLIPDLKGDWLSCVRTLPNAIILGQGQATKENTRGHGYAICEDDLQIILDVTSYDDMHEVAEIITNMIDGIFHWERKHPDCRKLCGVFLDEAQSYLPQDVKDSIISEPEARDAMLNAYMRVIAIGGSLGLFPVVMTQRLAQVNKKIVGQPELLFLFKQTLDNDLNRYKDFTSVPAEKVRALKQGYGIFVDYEGQSTIHKFHKRTSDDSLSRTPRYRPTSDRPRPTRETNVLDDWDEDLNGQTEMDPLPKRPASIIKIGTDLSTKRDVTITKEQFDMLLNMRKNGMLTGYRSIMKILPISETHAKNLNKLLLSALGERESESECE